MPVKPTLSALFSLFFSVLILSACSPVKVPPVQEYKLEKASTVRTRQTAHRYTLLVSKPLAASGYTTRDMRYMAKPYELASFAKNSWVAPPADMLETLLIESLENSQHFYAVVRAPFAGMTHYRLDTQLLSLRQNFLKRPSRIELAIKADLINQKTNKIVRSKRFIAEVKATEDTPYGGVMAANKAVRNVLGQIVRFSSV